MIPSSQTRPVTALVLDDFEEGLTEFDISVGAQDLGLQLEDMEATGPVAVHVAVGRTMQMFTVSARAEIAVRGDCCRCLSPAAAAVQADVKFLLQRKEGTDEEFEAFDDEDDVDLVDPGVKEFDLNERLHDAVILELPLRLYCKTDCKGLCPRCGHDLNAGDCDCTGDEIDPRWEALAQLKTRSHDPEGA